MTELGWAPEGTLEADLLTQLAWGQAFPEESSFLPGSLVGGFFPDPPPPTPAGLSSQFLQDWAYQVPLFPLSWRVNSRLCQGDETPDNAQKLHCSLMWVFQKPDRQRRPRHLHVGMEKPRHRQVKDVPGPQITRVAMHTLTWGLLQGWALGPFFF